MTITPIEWCESQTCHPAHLWSGDARTKPSRTVLCPGYELVRREVPMYGECSWHPGQFHGVCSEAVR